MFKLHSLSKTQTLNMIPVYFGANLKHLQQRMKSVGNIKKITKAMKMVATSK